LISNIQGNHLVLLLVNNNSFEKTPAAAGNQSLNRGSFILNPDNSISPKAAPHLVLGTLLSAEKLSHGYGQSVSQSVSQAKVAGSGKLKHHVDIDPSTARDRGKPGLPVMGMMQATAAAMFGFGAAR